MIGPIVLDKKVKRHKHKSLVHNIHVNIYATTCAYFKSQIDESFMIMKMVHIDYHLHDNLKICVV